MDPNWVEAIQCLKRAKANTAEGFKAMYQSRFDNVESEILFLALEAGKMRNGGESSMREEQKEEEEGEEGGNVNKGRVDKEKEHEEGEEGEMEEDKEEREIEEDENLNKEKEENREKGNKEEEGEKEEQIADIENLESITAEKTKKKKKKKKQKQKKRDTGNTATAGEAEGSERPEDVKDPDIATELALKVPPVFRDGFFIPRRSTDEVLSNARVTQIYDELLPIGLTEADEKAREKHLEKALKAVCSLPEKNRIFQKAKEATEEATKRYDYLKSKMPTNPSAEQKENLKRASQTMNEEVERQRVAFTNYMVASREVPYLFMTDEENYRQMMKFVTGKKEFTQLSRKELLEARKQAKKTKDPLYKIRAGEIKFDEDASRRKAEEMYLKRAEGEGVNLAEYKGSAYLLQKGKTDEDN